MNEGDRVSCGAETRIREDITNTYFIFIFYICMDGAPLT